MVRVPVWDPLLRLFHWCLVACVVGAVVTVKIGGNAMGWHGGFGQAVLALLVWRLVWGVIGPETARFRSFVRGPEAILAYLRGQWHGIGHNPLGALSVLALLAAFGVQAALGLFSYDEIAFRGPLARLLSEETQLLLTSWHRRLEPMLYALVLLHVGAIAFYRLVKKEDLLTPMITGYRVVASSPIPPGAPAPWHQKSYWMRAAIAVAIAAAVNFAASGAWIAPLPVPATPGMDW